LCQQFVGLGLNLLGGEFHFRLKAGKSYWVIGLSHGQTSSNFVPLRFGLMPVLRR